MKKSFAVICVIVCLCLQSPGAFSARCFASEEAAIVLRNSGMPSLYHRTMEQENTLLRRIQAPTSRYAEYPSYTAPYAAGKITEAFEQQTLDYINYVRFSAGLPPVAVKEEYSQLAQYGAALIGAIGGLNHLPGRPEDMDDAFYNRAYPGTSRSNLFQYVCDAQYYNESGICDGYAKMQIDAYMNDEREKEDRAVVGHRRWLLYPGLNAVGIGYTDRISEGAHAVYGVVNVNNADASASCPEDYDFIAWPASGCFPKALISAAAPWSISLNLSKYAVPNRKELSVYITRQSDQRTWKLDLQASSDAASSSFLLVNLERYGSPCCIVFKFDAQDEQPYEGSYSVRVEGIRSKSGSKVVIDYTVDFYGNTICSHEWNAPVIEKEPTCTQGGSAVLTCKYCGYTTTQRLNALGHPWVLAEVRRASTKYLYGQGRYVCSRCGKETTDIIPLLPCDAASCASQGYMDAPDAAAWSHNAVDFVLEQKLFLGTGSDRFSPTAPMTRGMFVTVLWRMAGSPASVVAAPYKDVKVGAYYSEAVKWANALGYINGVRKDEFCPEHRITKEQLAVILYRYFANQEANSKESLNTYADACDVQAYAVQAFSWAIENEIITGMRDPITGEKLLCPQHIATREQVAALIMRCMQVFGTAS